MRCATHCRQPGVPSGSLGAHRLSQTAFPVNFPQLLLSRWTMQLQELELSEWSVTYIY